MPTCEDTMAGSVSVSHLLDDRCHVNPDPIYSEVHANWTACSELLRAVRCKESAKALCGAADGEKDPLVGCGVVLATLWSTSRLSRHGCKMLPKQNADSLHPPFTHIVPESMSRQDEIQVLNLSRSSVWSCTQYGSAFSKYSVMTWVSHRRCIQLNFPAGQAIALPDFLLGACSAVGLTLLIGAFLCCSI